MSKSILPELRQIGVAKTEPGDENNQDISTLVGKVDIRKLEHFSQHDPDAYSYSGGLNRTTQGLLEFVEMFKAPIKVLHPLLTATQEGNYAGTENLGALPFQGIVLAHSNESEWEQFKNNKNNEAFLDRICVVKVPYCLRVTEEAMIYAKLLESSESVQGALRARSARDSCALLHPHRRIKEHQNSPLYSKLRVYNGDSLKDTDPKAKSVQEYREVAGVAEGMTGVSTRFAFKVLSETFNYDNEEIAADPGPSDVCARTGDQARAISQGGRGALSRLHQVDLAPRYAEFIGREIQKAYIESYSEYGQNLFDRYIAYADAWIEEQDFKDPDTGQVFDRQVLDAELSKTEKPAGIANPKDFRNEIVKFALRARASNNGKNPSWTSLRENPRSDREAHVQSSRGPAADHQLRGQAGLQDREAARRLSRADEGARLHRAAGSPAGRMVHAGQQGRMREERGHADMAHFVDRRLNPRDKSLGNRQRFLRRDARAAQAGGRQGGG